MRTADNEEFLNYKLQTMVMHDIHGYFDGNFGTVGDNQSIACTFFDWHVHTVQCREKRVTMLLDVCTVELRGKQYAARDYADKTALLRNAGVSSQDYIRKLIDDDFALLMASYEQDIEWEDFAGHFVWELLGEREEPELMQQAEAGKPKKKQERDIKMADRQYVIKRCVIAQYPFNEGINDCAKKYSEKVGGRIQLFVYSAGLVGQDATMFAFSEKEVRQKIKKSVRNGSIKYNKDISFDVTNDYVPF